MNLRQSFKLSIKSILSSKLRSALTMLGIIIGVAAVIILVSIIGGFSNSLKANFASMGATLVNVRITNRSSLRSFDESDFDSLVSENPDLFSEYSPLVNMSNATIKVGDTNATTTGYGTNEMYQDIKSLSVSQGSFLSYLNVDNRQKVCVIGYYVSSEFFSGSNPVGQTVKINGAQYTVIGVLSETNGGTQGSGDDCIYIPYTTAVRLTGSGQISSYVIEATGTDKMNDAVNKVQTVLYNALGSTNYFTVSNSSRLQFFVNATPEA